MDTESTGDSISLKLSPKHIFLAGLVAGLLLAGAGGFVWVVSGGAMPAKAPGIAANNPLAANPQANQPQPGQVGEVAPVSAADWVRGNRNAKVALVVYSDTECPFCKRFHVSLNEVAKAYGSKLAIVYRPFPLAQLHSKAPKEAEALECVGELGGNDKYWAYLDKIFEVTPSNDGLDAAQLPELAGQIGIDKAKFSSCLSSGKYTAKIAQAVAAAEAAGAGGTPFSVVLAGSQKIPVEGAVPTDQLKSILDSVLK
jgi:protein-disulfide isomerase